MENDDILDIDELHKKYDAGVDTGTNWTGLGLTDDELARRLQIAEGLPGETPIAHPDWNNPAIVNVPQLEQNVRNFETARLGQYHAEAEARHARQEAAQARQDAAAARQAQAAATRPAAAVAAPVPTYTNRYVDLLAIPYGRTKYVYDSDLRDRLYRWGLDLFPSYNILETTQRKSLSDKLDKFIAQRLREKLTESEIENRIRRFLENSEYDAPSRKRATAPTRTRKSASKPRRKSKKTPKKRSLKSNRGRR